MGTFKILVMVVLLVLLFVTSGVTSANISASNAEENMEYEDRARTRDGANGGMVPLFDMLKIFLNDVVQPKTIGDLMDDFGIETFDDFTSDEFLDSWKEWVLYIVGFAVCVVVGVLFVIVMPICGCCYCCCRNYCCCCCFKSCRKKPRQEKPSSKCRRVCYGTTVFVMSSFLLAGTICVFVSNGMLQGELSDTGVMSDLSSGLKGIEGYLDDSLDDINATLLQEMFKTTDQIFTLLDGLPDESLQAIEDDYGIGDALSQLNQFTSSLEPLSDDFGQMYNLTEDLKTQVSSLDAALLASRTSLDTLLTTSCGVSSCGTAHNSLYLVAPDATYANISTLEAHAAKVAVDTALSEGIVEQVQAAVDAYKSITDQVLNQTSSDIDELKTVVQELEEQVVEAFDDISSTLDNSSNFDGIYNAFDDVQEILDDYAPYYTKAIWILTMLLLFISLCNFLGLLFGGILHKPKARSGRMSCTTHQGANWLMAGIAFTFFFTWLFMLLTTLHFAVGGAMETFMCRHLVTYDDTMVQIEEMIMQDVDYNISIREALESCKHDASLYEAANVEENGFNITELMDLEQYGIYEAIDELKNITVDLGEVEILTPEMNETVITLDSYLKAIDYESYEDELAKDVTKIDLMDYVDLLDKVIVDLGSDPNAALIRAEADLLTAIYDTNVTQMEDDRILLGNAVADARSITEAADLTKLMLDLTASQNSLNEDGGAIVTDLLVQYGEETIKYIEDYADSTEDAIREDVGACRAVFDAGQTLVYGPCLYFLEPFNAFWFCYGWFIFFSIPSIIFGSCLARLYRETQSSNAVAHSDVQMIPIAVVSTEAKKSGVKTTSKVAPLPQDEVKGQVIDYGDFTKRSGYSNEILLTGKDDW